TLRRPRRGRDVDRPPADRRHAAADDLPDVAWIDAGAFDRGPLHHAEKIGGMEAGEPALAATDRAPHRGQNDDVLHGAGVSHRSVRRGKTLEGVGPPPSRRAARSRSRTPPPTSPDPSRPPARA